MSLEIVASFPVSSRWVLPCLVSILDKKVAGVQLYRFERWLHWFFFYFYSPYHSLYYSKKGRILSFQDRKALLYDCTKEKVVSIMKGKKEQLVCVSKIPVSFQIGPHIKVRLGIHKKTHSIIAMDKPDSPPGWVRFIEKDHPTHKDPHPLPRIWDVYTKKNGNRAEFRVEQGSEQLFSFQSVEENN